MKYGVFVGRFQPFHTGHATVVRNALSQVDRLIIVIGSAFRASNTRNPFSYDQRKAMIERTFHYEVSQDRIIFAGIPDYPGDERWETELRSLVNKIVAERNRGQTDTIGLCGQEKDHTSYYIKKFPEWEKIGVDSGAYMISATHIRERFFSPLPEIAKTWLPAGTVEVMDEFQKSPLFIERLEESRAKKTRDKAWAAAPFPPKDVCGDALLVQSGHVALVTRGKWPGKGLLAMPGGHVEEYETVRDAAIREAREETWIEDGQGRIPPGRLGSYIAGYKCYDDPYRSDFGRVISHTFLFRLPDAKPLWKIRGMDDAAHADWYPIASLRSEQFHDDHFYVIQDMLGL